MTAHSPVSAELPALPDGVSIATLENGLTIIVREDHSAPVVSAQAWARTGAVNEGKWLGAGLSHVLEHMLFKGTTTRGPGRIDQEVQEAGGYMNAYTSFDRTVYYIDVPNTGGATAIDILCDIMQHAALPADELVKELDVIRREMDMCHDDPGRRSSRRLFETAYTRSPYRLPVIGLPDIFNAISRDDIAAYYTERYAPNNVFYVVTGDVKAADVAAQIKASYAKTKTRALPPEVLPTEPPQTAARETIEEGSVEIGRVHMSWHIPDIRHADVPVLDVLAGLLGNGRSSRLYREVRERRQLVTSVDAWTYNPGNPGLFGVSAVMEPEKFAETRAAILAEIERLRNEPPTAAEIAKVVKQYVSATLSSRKTMAGQAQDLGSSWIAANDLNFSERYLAAVKRTTPEAVRRVVQTYLTPENRSLYALLPEGTAPKATLTEDRAHDHPVKKFTLSNGLRVLIKEDHRLPFVQLQIGLRGGVLAETPATNGLTQLFTKMQQQGTTSRSAAEVATEIESLGGHIEAFGGNNSFGLTCEVMNEDFAAGLALFADVLLNPAFPADALERERAIQLANLKAQRDQLLQSAMRAMRRTLFGQSGYGLETLGNEASVKSITVDSLRQFHRDLVSPNNAVLAIFGHVQTDAVLAQLEKTFGGWKANPQTPSLVDRRTGITTPTKPERVEEERDKKQAVLAIGFKGAALDSPDRYALELIQESCSDLGSRLFLRIRDELGLAYYVGAQNMLGIGTGVFSFYCGTAPEKAAQVETELLREARLLAESGLTPEELKRSKAKIIGQKKISRQDLGSHAMNTLLNEIYGLGHDFTEHEDEKLQAVTLEDCIAAARKYLVPDRYIVAVVKPSANATEEE